MSSDTQLQKALSSIDWNKPTGEFLKDSTKVKAIASGCERIALWGNCLRESDPKNPAVPFLFEMQRSTHDVAALLSLSLYVPAAAAMRAMCETAIYYSYFRNHPAELSTLATKPEFFISKTEVLAFHKQHTPSYRQYAKDFGLPGVLDQWYSRVSGIVHGQLPGAWAKRLALADTGHSLLVLSDAVETFEKGVEIVHLFLLVSLGPELWGRFHHSAKAIFLKGMPAQQRTWLGLDGK